MSEETEQPKRRGRPALPPEKGKRYAIGIRTTRDLKGLLQQAADSSGRSLAQEIEFRLERSFDRQQTLADAMLEKFDGVHMLDVFEELIKIAAISDTWLDDWEEFDSVVDNWNKYLQSVRPKEPKVRVSDLLRELREIAETPCDQLDTSLVMRKVNLAERLTRSTGQRTKLELLTLVNKILTKLVNSE